MVAQPALFILSIKRDFNQFNWCEKVAKKRSLIASGLHEALSDRQRTSCMDSKHGAGEQMSR